MVLQQENYEKGLSKCLIAFGSNLSNKFGASVQLLNAALAQMSSNGLFMVEASRFFRTPAFPAKSGPDFVNGAVLCETALSAQEVLEVLHRIESDLGRERIQRWGARVIDLDLIDFDGQVRPDIETYQYWRDLALPQQMKDAPEQLILPHPRVQDRLFVLIPLRDVAPDWRHPVQGDSVADMIAAFGTRERDEVVPLDVP